jgi:N-acetylglucosamine-6-phosphate deacetylase
MMLTNNINNIPGFVDLQVNGCKGIDFSGDDLTDENFRQACRDILTSGTAAFLPTVITGSTEMYRQNLPLIANVIQSGEMKNQILGIHLEGPFINPDPGAHGAHDPKFIRKPNLDDFKQMLEWSRGTIKLLTVAADVPDAEELTRCAVEQGIVVSLGHHLATQDDLKRLKQAGASLLTHLGNGVPNQLDRHHNPIWDGLADDDFHMTIITDGHHLPPAVIKTFIRAKGIAKTIVISDASALAGLPPARYYIHGSQVIIEKNGQLHSPQTGYLAGSTAMMLQCMNHLDSLELVNLKDLLDMGFYNPLKLLTINSDTIPRKTNLLFDDNTKKFTINNMD